MIQITPQMKVLVALEPAAEKGLMVWHESAKSRSNATRLKVRCLYFAIAVARQLNYSSTMVKVSGFARSACPKENFVGGQARPTID